MTLELSPPPRPGYTHLRFSLQHIPTHTVGRSVHSLFIFSFCFQPQRLQHGQLTLSQSADKASKSCVGVEPLQKGIVPFN
jgi:hypothetical protein